jgi:uncharacterized protein YacL
MLLNLSLLSASIFDGIIKDTANSNTLLSTVMSIVWWAAVMLAVIFVAYAGFQYATSSGDSNRITEAKSQIMNGIIGLVIILLIGVVFRLALSWV